MQKASFQKAINLNCGDVVSCKGNGIGEEEEIEINVGPEKLETIKKINSTYKNVKYKKAQSI